MHTGIYQHYFVLVNNTLYVMKKSFILLILSLTLVLGCSPDYLLERKEDKLIGLWSFEKAFFRGNGDLFRENVIDEFRGDRIEFFSNYDAIYDDYSLNATFDGVWELSFDRFVDDDGDDVEFFLDMTFYDYTVDEPFSYNCGVNQITRNRMELKARTRNGVYTFKLEKL